ncbi:MAG: nucleoside 2-deoxyribosyltransferase, partial [Candidatus Lokiarchaeota archaeon]|nr:nucleoside 2-deoxyribosyltransferase [Candidatus Lokiarchaeota archaeon]
CGFQPILIDEVNYESEITINDAIIKNIKECKFLIADFSGQRHGVYFEAGYALGKGRQVIYLCSEEDFENTHFDTNHYPHIVYRDLNELKERLKNKIQAWID